MPDAHWGYGFPIGGVAAFDPGSGRRRFRRRRRLRHLLRRAHDADRPVGRRHSSGAEGAGRFAVPANSGRRRQHGRDHARCRRDGRDAVGRRPLGGRARLGRGARPRADRGAGTDGRCAARMRVRPRQGAPAPRDGHARLRQSLSRSPGGRRNLRSGGRRGLRAHAGRCRRHHPLRLARARPSDRHRVPEGNGGDREGSRASNCPTASSPARRSIRRSASAISARCARRSTARWPIAKSSATTPAASSRISFRIAICGCCSMSRTTPARSSRTWSTASGATCSCIARARPAPSGPATRACPPRCARSASRC